MNCLFGPFAEQIGSPSRVRDAIVTLMFSTFVYILLSHVLLHSVIFVSFSFMKRKPF